MRLLAAGVVALAIASSALATTARNVDLLRAFRTQVAKVKQRSAVPILLPHDLPLIDGNYRLYAEGFGTNASWGLDLAAAKNCGGANACFIASFDAQDRGKLSFKPNLRLHAGDPAYYHPVSCGASCAPATLWFTHAGVLYTWQVKGLDSRTPKLTLARLANEAIAAGPR